MCASVGQQVCPGAGHLGPVHPEQYSLLQTWRQHHD